MIATALAHSILHYDRHRAAVPRSRFRPRAQQPIELDVPSDELRQSPPRLDVETALLPSPADQLVNQHGRVATLDREQATRFPLERLGGHTIGRLADPRRAGWCHLLEPSGDVGRIALRGVV